MADTSAPRLRAFGDWHAAAILAWAQDLAALA